MKNDYRVQGLVLLAALSSVYVLGVRRGAVEKPRVRAALTPLPPRAGQSLESPALPLPPVQNTAQTAAPEPSRARTAASRSWPRGGAPSWAAVPAPDLGAIAPAPAQPRRLGFLGTPDKVATRSMAAAPAQARMPVPPAQSGETLPLEQAQAGKPAGPAAAARPPAAGRTAEDPGPAAAAASSEPEAVPQAKSTARELVDQIPEGPGRARARTSSPVPGPEAGPAAPAAGSAAPASSGQSAPPTPRGRPVSGSGASDRGAGGSDASDSGGGEEGFLSSVNLPRPVFKSADSPRPAASGAGQAGASLSAVPAAAGAVSLERFKSGRAEPAGRLYSRHTGQEPVIKVYRLDTGGPNKPVAFVSGMDIDADGAGGAWKKDKTGQSETSLKYSNGESVDPSKIPFAVVPLGFRQDFPDIRMGDYCSVSFNGRTVYGILADFGPSRSLGEASMSMAASLGIDPDPNHGGTSKPVTYIYFPGTRDTEPPREADLIQKRGAEVMQQHGLGLGAP